MLIFCMLLRFLCLLVLQEKVDQFKNVYLGVGCCYNENLKCMPIGFGTGWWLARKLL